MKSIVEQEFWDGHWDRVPTTYSPDNILFQDLFNKHLPRGGTCFEVGCYPGNFLIYLGKTFGYEVSGIDMTPMTATQMPAHLANHGVKVGELILGDFLNHPLPKQYTVVCSFGFVEHFADFETIINRHVELVEPGGMLVISCPNFRKVQRLLHWGLDKQNLHRHVLKAMDTSKWAKIVSDAGMKPLYSGYYRTMDFWSESPQSRLQVRVEQMVKRAARWIDKRIDFPNLLTSPYMILIAQKPKAA